MNEKWLVFNFTETYDVIYWWVTHDGVDDILPGYEFDTQIVYLKDNGTEVKCQVRYNSSC
jgi:hypothetical protein